MFEQFDGTERTPRSVQTQALNWLAEGWSAPIHAIQGPVGSGKSGLGRAIQIETGAHVITPSNILIDQYIDTYPDQNYLKGKAHYRCRWGVSCKDWTDTMEQKACDGCIYKQRRDAAQHEPTFFNPMSFYYLRLNTGVQPKVLVVDEAHQVASMVLALCAKKFRQSVYRFSDRCTDALYLITWLEEQCDKLRKLLSQYQKHNDYQKCTEIVEELESVKKVLEGLNEDTENYAIWINDGMYRGRPERFLNVKPVRPPRFMINSLLGADKLVLMSGTLMKTDIADLVGDQPYRFIDLPSPIPKERRRILYRPTPFPMNYRTDPKQIAAWIEDVLDDHPNQNALVHVTYSMSLKLRPHFRRPILVNGPEDKIEKVDFFKRHGGVFLASGCAEGLDFKDDYCRVNIVPKLAYPDLNDPVVQKRRAMADGQEWYALETLKTVIQATGRSTRHEKDASTSYILDPTFGGLFQRYRSKLPQSFNESIVWAY